MIAPRVQGRCVLTRMPSNPEPGATRSESPTRTGTSGFWENLKAGARHAASRGAWYFAGKVWSAVRVLFSLRGHIAVQKLLSHPQCRMLIREQPLLPLKYAAPY